MELVVEHFAEGNHGTFLIMQAGQRVGEMTYRKESVSLAIIDHTEVTPSLRGGGVARKLLDAAVQWARDNHIRLGATCSYAVVQFARDPSIQDVRG
ncbi:MAG: GNAT family N-acetyltransferase [Pseudomonadota bacterium]